LSSIIAQILLDSHAVFRWQQHPCEARDINRYLGQNAFGDHRMPDRIDTSVDCKGYRRTLNTTDTDKPPSNSEIERDTTPVASIYPASVKGAL
jgi:hypothetical protein